MRVTKISKYIGTGIKPDGDLDHKELSQYIQYVSNLDGDVLKLYRAVQGNLRFVAGSNQRGENIFGFEVSSSDTGTANTEFSLSHSLSSSGVGIIPTRFIVTYINKGGVIYDSGTAWTTSTVYFKCSAASANVKIFLIP